MSFYSEDRCTGCNQLTSPELMVTKQVNFLERTRRGKVIKSRVVAWLCEECTEADPDFQLPAYSGPANTSAALERVRRDEVL
jgi:hypothetical protein